MTTTARDVTDVRAIMQLVLTATVERTELCDAIAAALSERERATVERCCEQVCDRCKEGLNAVVVTSGRWWHFTNDGIGKGSCKAHAIRAAAARQESV